MAHVQVRPALLSELTWGDALDKKTVRDRNYLATEINTDCPQLCAGYRSSAKLLFDKLQVQSSKGGRALGSAGKSSSPLDLVSGEFSRGIPSET